MENILEGKVLVTWQSDDDIIASLATVFPWNISEIKKVV